MAVHRNAELSPEFIQHQRRRLEALREQLLGDEGQRLARERTFREEHAEEPRDPADTADDATQLEIEQAQHDVDERRLSGIDRALQKVAEGTYGVSDVSGETIPKARLEATPEAVLTVQEEQERRKPFL